MKQTTIKNLSHQIKDLAEKANLAADAAKGSAAVAYQASVQNVKALKEVHETVKEISKDVKDNLVQSTKTNGRVTNLEKWSEEAKTIIENNSTALGKYATDKKIAIAAYILIALLGGSIITLSIMAINSKIKDGYSSPEVRKIIKDIVVEANEETLLDYDKIIIENNE